MEREGRGHSLARFCAKVLVSYRVQGSMYVMYVQIEVKRKWTRGNGSVSSTSCRLCRVSRGIQMAPCVPYAMDGCCIHTMANFLSEQNATREWQATPRILQYWFLSGVGTNGSSDGLWLAAQQNLKLLTKIKMQLPLFEQVVEHLDRHFLKLDKVVILLTQISLEKDFVVVVGHAGVHDAHTTHNLQNKK